jgi:hypothetical protein
MMGRQERDGNHSPLKIDYYRIQREIKKMDTQFQTPTNKDRLSQGTQQSP